MRTCDTALSAGRLPLLVFDFDGVLCDSLQECMMVAWYAHEDEPIERFLDPGIGGIPKDVVQRFEACRPFMRHLGHFLVPLVDVEVPTTHAEFAARFAALPCDQVDGFVSAAEDYRSRLRSAHPATWRARHTVDVRLGALVRDGYIATARDRDSVGQILRSYDIDVPDERVFGSLRDKPRALETITARENRAPLDVVLVDDSVENCIAARDAGFAAYWASWGYHADADGQAAIGHGIPVVTVKALLRVRGVSPS